MFLSKYNIPIKMNNKIILYNSFNHAICELEKSEYKDLIKKNYNTTLINELIDQGFIVENNDELDILKLNYKYMQFDTTNISLTICPTMDCIFKCPYCFESRKQGNMTAENQKKLIDFVKAKITKQTKTMDVLWFGGEPLMAWSVIENLSEKLMQICNKENISYRAYIISNGYLINNNIINGFIKYKIDGIQITIDGPKEIHDKRRILKNNEGSYDKIVQNIKLLQDSKKIKIDVRINIDKTNENDIVALFDDFSNKKLYDVRFDFGHILNYTDNCKSIACNCLTRKNFSKKVLEYNKILRSYNFYRNKRNDLPEPISIYCGAEKYNAYNIDENLNLYKCWNDMGDKSKSIGKIGDENRTELERKNERDYMLWDPFKSKKCKKCQYLPLCLGGCPFMGKKINRQQCDKWKYIIADMVEEYVKHS